MEAAPAGRSLFVWRDCQRAGARLLSEPFPAGRRPADNFLTGGARLRQTESAARSRHGTPRLPVRESWRSSLLSGVAALAFYLVLAPSACGDKDAAEFTLVLATGGVAHPTGYPLYTLLGHPFVLILHALGASWAYAANAWSALGGAVAVALLHRLARGLVADRTGGALLAILPVALFGLNPIWTFETTLAETGAWHVAWAAGAALLCLHVLSAPEVNGARGAARLRRGAFAWGLMCGLGLAHHLTATLLVLPLTAALIVRLPFRMSLTGVWLPALAGATLPLLTYGVIAWRAFHPAAVQWPLLEPSWTSFVEHVTAAQYRNYFGAFRPSPGQAASLVRYAYPFLGLAALALATAIATAGSRARRDTLLALSAGLLIQCAVVFSYGVPDPTSYFLPVLGLGLVATAPAAAWLSGKIGGRRRGLVAAGALAVAVGVLVSPWIGKGWARRDAFIQHERMLRGMWQSITIDRGLVLWADDMVYRLHIWQVLDGEKPGLEVLNPAMLSHPWPRREFARTHGFDPADGLRLAEAGTAAGGLPKAQTEELVDRLAQRLNEESELPVIVFDPAGRSVRMLRKPASQRPGIEPSR